MGNNNNGTVNLSVHAFKNINQASKTPYIDSGFGLIKAMSDVFWGIPDVRAYQAENLDVFGTDVEGTLKAIMKRMKK